MEGQVFKMFRLCGTMSSELSWSSSPMNCGSCRLQISSLWLLKCCVLWPQRTMAHQVTNSLSVTSQMLWCKAQRTVAVQDQKMATKLVTKWSLSQPWLLSRQVVSKMGWERCPVYYLIKLSYYLIILLSYYLIILLSYYLIILLSYYLNILISYYLIILYDHVLDVYISVERLAMEDKT